jgi:hypothetical protein
VGSRLGLLRFNAEDVLIAPAEVRAVSTATESAFGTCSSEAQSHFQLNMEEFSLRDFGRAICKRHHCGATFTKARRDQLYCSTRCRVGEAMKRYRAGCLSEAITSEAQVIPLSQRSDNVTRRAVSVSRSDHTPATGLGLTESF